MTRLSALVAALLLCTAILALPALARCGEMYYYEDEDGRLHFTNRPSGSAYRVFAVFRNFPAADKGDILRVIKRKSDAYGLDHRLVQAVIQVESNYEPQAVSHKGAQGLMQIMPSTGAELGMKDPHNVEDNIEAGVKYLRMQFDRFKDAKLALAAYNAGPAQVERYGGIPPFAETRAYVRKVLAIYNKLSNGGS